ncbi:MAG: LysR family transcriptional regulator [Oscillochloris sp.]|nr:LysR family transcriptional regulator [Oscillochloris sp.]
MLNTIHLRTFLTVVDAGSYSAAAQRLHMSQPAVSQQIRALEEQLGNIRLFRRVGQRMAPTHAGEELLPSARELVQLAERAEQNIVALRGQLTGRVLVGCTASSGERLLPRLLAIFHSRHPAVSIEMGIGTTDDLLDAVAERRIGLALLEDPPRRRGLEAITIGSEPLLLIAPSGHPLLKQNQVPPGVLRDHPLALPRAGNVLRRIIEDGLRRRSLTPTDLQLALESDSVTTLIEAVRAGFGMAFVPRSCLPARASGYDTVELAGNPLHQEWFLVRPRERGGPRASHALIDFLLDDETMALWRKLGITPERKA